MTEQKDKQKPLDDLLSMRGKPFVDWKEERKYLKEKWGIQGRQVKHEEILTNQNLEAENPKNTES